MIGIIRNMIKDNAFLKNIGVLMSGSVLVQILVLTTAPILTRIYSPFEYGVYGTVLSIFAVLSVVSSLKFDLAILVEDSMKKVRELQFLSIIIVFIFSFLAYIFINYLPLGIFKINKDVNTQLVWIPFLILSNGLFVVFSNRINRAQKFTVLSISVVVNRLLMVLTQMALGYFGYTSEGLIIGNLLGFIGGVFYLLMAGDILNFKDIVILNKNNIISIAKKHYRFPLFAAPKELINSFSTTIPVYFIGPFYGVEAVGIYWLSVRIVFLPNVMISNSFRQAYYNEINTVKSDLDKVFILFKKSTKNLLAISIIPSLVIIFFGPMLFEFFFGEEWRLSGEIARWLIFWVLTSFINPPSTILFNIFNIQKVDLIFNIIQVVLRLFVFIIGGYYLTLLNTIILFSLISALVNISIIIYIYKFISNKIEYATSN